MIEKLKKAVKKLQDAQEFKNFKKKNPGAYLVSCIIITDGKKTGDWQVDYYQPKKHKITTFILEDELWLKREDDIFQKEKTGLKELKLNKVKISMDEMLELMEKLRKKKYPGDCPNKIISILQNLDGKTIWNVTSLTSTLKIWNIKLDAENGRVIEEKIENVFSLKPS